MAAVVVAETVRLNTNHDLVSSHGDQECGSFGLSILHLIEYLFPLLLELPSTRHHVLGRESARTNAGGGHHFIVTVLSDRAYDNVSTWRSGHHAALVHAADRDRRVGGHHPHT